MGRRGRGEVRVEKNGGKGGEEGEGKRREEKRKGTSSDQKHTIGCVVSGDVITKLLLGDGFDVLFGAKDGVTWRGRGEGKERKKGEGKGKRKGKKEKEEGKCKPSGQEGKADSCKRSKRSSSLRLLTSFISAKITLLSPWKEKGKGKKLDKGEREGERAMTRTKQH